MLSLLRSARIPLVSVCCAGLVAISGCANMVETRAITAFTQALQEQDSQKAREMASTRFEQKALRLDESIEDFAVLRLPKGEINITNVENVTDTEKKVTVEIGERKERVKYRLTREPGTSKWVIDDIQIRQKKGNIVATRSVTELMDLITSVREFLRLWSRGSRSDMIALSTPELSSVLSQLPAEYLEELAKLSIGDKVEETRIKPEAQIDDEAAIVRLPRKAGQMLISFQKHGSQWLVHDVKLENRADKDKQVPSMRQFAIAMVSAVKFLDAYQAGDKTQLKEISKPSFFAGSLETSDLQLVPLPTSKSAVGAFQLRIEAGLADFIISSASEVVTLTLVRAEGEDSKTAMQYLVSDLTIYDLEDKQEKRLSALFSAREIVEAFAEAVIHRDRDTLLALSTNDFKKRVWNRADETLFMQLPLLEVENSAPHVVASVYSGAVTEITVRQGNRALNYVLHDKQGKLFVDDIILPSVGRPNSFKQTYDLLVSVQRFQNALADMSLDALQVTSSREFNRVVWHSATTVPNIGMNPLPYLSQPLLKMDLDEKTATVVFGDDRYGAKVMLVKEGEQFVVDDVLLVNGLEAKQRVLVRDTMKLELSRFRGNRSVD